MGKPSPAAAPQVLALDPPVIAAIVVVAVSVIFLIMRAMGGSKKKFLNKQVQYVTLGERVNLSHDTVRFRLMLPKSAPVLGLPVGQHFKIMCPNPKGKVAGQWNGREDPEDGEEEIERKYTPTTSDDDIGFADLVIKVYKGGVIDRFPDGGKMSQYFDSLKVGDRVKMSGPWGTHEYMGRGLFKSGRKEHKCTKVGMMAGGTGITPMLQVMAAILKDSEDETTISLLYANQTEDDILVRDMLESLQAKHPTRLKIWYTVDRAPPGWKYSEGFITAEMIAAHLPAPSTDTLILMCGPPPMVKFACQQNLDKLGYAKDTQIAF